jgi:rubrerythrin
MDLSKYTLKDIILTALKSEVESKELYEKMKNRVSNFVLRDKFDFLAKEEEKHRVFFEKMFAQNFPGETVALPDKSPVPLPEIGPEVEKLPISEVLEIAMKAELKASEFYKSMMELFSDEMTRKTLEYISTVELSHYKLLEAERDYAKKFEDYEVEWPGFHIGA